MNGRRGRSAVAWKFMAVLAAIFTCTWIVSTLLLSSLVDAKIRFQGNDFSRAIVGSGDTDMIVCDRERDGHSVKTIFSRVGQGNFTPTVMKDPTADLPCQKNFGIRQIYYHRTCEILPGFMVSDRCTANSFH